MGALHDVRAVLLANQFAVLEEALVARESIGVIAERDEAESPDPAASELALKPHAVGAEENSAAMEPSLHEFTLVSVSVKNGTGKTKRQ